MNLTLSAPSDEQVKHFAKQVGSIALIYFIVSFSGTYLTPYVNTFTFAEWPAIAIAVAVGLRFGWAGILATFIGSLFFHLVTMPIELALLLAFTTSMTAFLFKFFTGLFFPDLKVINTVSSVAVFALVVTPLVVAIHALFALLCLDLYHFVVLNNIGQSFLSWWFSEVLIIYLATPLILSWLAYEKQYESTVKKIEVVSILSAMVIVSALVIVYGQIKSPSDIVIFVLLPFVLIAALRFKSFGAHIAIFLAAIIAFVTLLLSHAQISPEAYTQAIFTLQISLVPTTLGGLFVASAFSERHTAEAKLNKLANHDPLTGLPNRTYFQDFLVRALAHAQRQKHQVYLLFIDLDRFKKINDSQGHELGDVVLKIIATRLNDILRTDDFIARLGGDEFAVVFTHPPINNAANNLAKKIIKIISEPFELNGRKYSVGASIGISVYPNDANDANTLLRQADLAMYQAKNRQSGFEYFSEDMNAFAHEQLQIENGLRQALENNELLLMYQPKLDLKTKKVVGLEALVRWLSKNGTLTSPDKFIPIAEETGLIVPIGRYVIREACEQWVRWHHAGLNPPPIAVNISPRQFSDAYLLRDIRETIESTGMVANMLHVEITESATMDDPEMTMEILQSMRKLHLHLYIDDFGTGHSNLGQLRRLPIDALKVDKSFINDMLTNNDDAEIVTAIINLGHALKLKIICEGIETVEQLDFLKELKCDEVQGYLISKPMPHDQVTSIFNKTVHIKREALV